VAKKVDSGTVSATLMDLRRVRSLTQNQEYCAGFAPSFVEAVNHFNIHEIASSVFEMPIYEVDALKVAAMQVKSKAKAVSFGSPEIEEATSCVGNIMMLAALVRHHDPVISRSAVGALQEYLQLCADMTGKVTGEEERKR
jgi:hypothetical protein